MNQQSRFKFYLVSPEQRAKEASQLQLFVRAIQNLNDEPSFSAAESVTLFVLTYLQLRHPQEWAMSSGKTAPRDSFHGRELALLGKPFLFLSSLKSKCLMDILLEYRPKKLPESVFEVLWNWAQEKYNLVLFDRVPTPLEMLEHQAEGQRVVTMDLVAAQKGELVDGKRDAFEFLLHDLIHADLFFKSPEGFADQREFFSKLYQQIVKYDLLAKGDSQFVGDLHYLMADMNSHRAHLQAHWEAILIQWRLRQEQKGSKDVLSSQGREWVAHLLS